MSTTRRIDCTENFELTGRDKQIARVNGRLKCCGRIVLSGWIGSKADWILRIDQRWRGWPGTPSTTLRRHGCVLLRHDQRVRRRVRCVLRLGCCCSLRLHLLNSRPDRCC